MQEILRDGVPFRFWRSPLFCIVTGYERAGTTMMSELIRQHPAIDGRFECGFLLSDNPGSFRDMTSYAENLVKAWGLGDGDLSYICQAANWSSMYRRLLERSDLPNKRIRIYDKTPRYMRHLREVLSKVTVPCLTIVRDPRALYWSQSRRNPMRVGEFCGYFQRYAEEWMLAKAEHKNILLVRYEELCTNVVPQARRIYDFLGLKFDERYVNLDNSGDPYVVPGGINDSRLMSYKGHLSAEEEAVLLERTSNFSEWHWH